MCAFFSYLQTLQSGRCAATSGQRQFTVADRLRTRPPAALNPRRGLLLGAAAFPGLLDVGFAQLLRGNERSDRSGIIDTATFPDPAPHCRHAFTDPFGARGNL